MRYEAMLQNWTQRINLVASSTTAAIWERHILDCAQIWPIARSAAERWVDLGSGPGLPGLIIATLATDLNPDANIILVEADRRKAAFLNAAIRELGLIHNTSVWTCRIEDATPLAADVVTARALAPLKTLLLHAECHLAPGGEAIFPKGRSVAREIPEASRHWRFDLALYESITDAEAKILHIRNLRRV